MAKGQEANGQMDKTEVCSSKEDKEWKSPEFRVLCEGKPLAFQRNEQVGRKFCLKGVILGVTIIKGKVYA